MLRLRTKCDRGHLSGVGVEGLRLLDEPYLFSFFSESSLIQSTWSSVQRVGPYPVVPWNGINRAIRCRDLMEHCSNAKLRFAPFDSSIPFLFCEINLGFCGYPRRSKHQADAGLAAERSLLTKVG